MAGKKARDLEKAVSLFPRGSAKAIQRLLKRAQEKAAKTAQRDVVKALRGASKGGRLGSRIGSYLASELAKAVSQRGAPRKEAPSIRQKASAAQGGGKPFHFAHSVVTKADPTAPATSRASKGGKAAAHMRYIERETAVEGPVRGGPEVAALAEDLARSVEKGGKARDDGSWDRGLGEGREANLTMGSAAAAQGYVENAQKLDNGERILFSFGNIGAAYEDRVRFWSALEEAEAHPGARVQHRLIVELPHEATPEARYEIIKSLTERFANDGVPFWAALHAPGKDNDSRNFHAHIVYSERPAKRVIDAVDGRERWDFEVIRRYVDSSRHTKTSRPMRQKKLRQYNDRRFIADLRKRYSELANAVLARDDVRDAAGSPVRYDHRSYKDMGVDATPMRSVNRIVADRLKDGRATVLDGDYTRKMVAGEIQAAARARDKRVLELIALDRALMDVVRNPKNASKVNPRLPKAMRVSPLAMLSKAVLANASKRLMEARHAAVRLDVMEKATAASLTRIIEATDPKAVAAAAKAKDPLVKAAAPDPAVAALLHEAAKEELAETRAQAAKERQTLSYRAAAAIEVWRTAVAPFSADPTPSTRAVMKAAREARPRGYDAKAAEPPQALAEALPQVQPDAREHAQPGPESARPTERTSRATTTHGAETTSSHASAPKAEATSSAKEEPPRASAAEASATKDADGAARGEGPKAKGIDPEDLKKAAKKYADALLKKTIERANAGGAAASTAAPANRPRGRAPTPAEAEMASAGVTAFIKLVGQMTDSVEDRLKMFQHWTTRPIFKPMSAGPKPKAEDKAKPDETRSTTEDQANQTPTGEASAKPTIPTTEAKAAAAPPPASEPDTTKANEDTASTGQSKAPASRQRNNAKTQPEQADLWPAEAQDARRVSTPRDRRDSRERTAAMTTDEPTEMGALGVQPKPAGGRVPTTAAAGLPDVAEADPPDAKKRRKRTPEEEEEDRRRKQRRAILAKRRKGREISR